VSIEIPQNQQSGKTMRSLSRSRSRMQSLDVLRGLTVALMILVNNAGDGAVSYAQLRHSVWSGCTLTAWLDRLLIPQAHLYHQGFYDPEGLLSTLPALATTLFGVLAAAWILTDRPVWKKSAALFSGGLILLTCGLLWAGLSPK
jgi:predicted acyltransferase